MKDWLLNLIPDDLLNLIWRNVKPSVKYRLNKKSFYLYYYYRFAYINSKHIFLYKTISIHSNYKIQNFQYIKYLIITDNKFVIEHIFFHKIYNDTTKYIYKTSIKFEQKTFNNFVDLCYYYSKKYNAVKIYNYINVLIKKYKLEDLIKKEHKNKGKNNNNKKSTLWRV